MRRRRINILLFLIFTEACILLSGSHILPKLTHSTEEFLQTEIPDTLHTYGISLDIKNGRFSIYRTEESAAVSQPISN